MIYEEGQRREGYIRNVGPQREGHFFRKQPGESIVGIFYEWMNTLSDRAVCFGKMYKDVYIDLGKELLF